MLIPVSAILVERHEELEVFILNEEEAMIQPQRMVEKKVDPKVKEPRNIVVAPKEEVRERIENKGEIKKEEFKKIEEKPITEKTEPHVIEPAPPRVELPPVPISIPVAPSPKETELSKKQSPSPPIDSSPKTEVRETVAILEEIPPMVSPRFQEVEFGTKEGPRFSRRVLPVYPMMARRLGKEGQVLLRLTIDEKGNLSEVEVIEHGGYGFTESAVEAVKKSSFLPALKDGKPIASRALLPIRFNLRSE